MKQGAWTDVYALGGVLYHLATGKVPMQAVSRMMSDPMKPVAELTEGRFSPNFSDAVAKAMSVHVDNRFQTVTEFRKALGWNVMQAQVVTLPPPQVWLEPKPGVSVDEKTGPRTSDRAAQPSTANTPARVTSTTPEDPIIKGERSMPPRAVETTSRTPLIAGVAVAVVAAIAAAIWFGRGSNTASVASPPVQPPPVAAVPATLPEPLTVPAKATPEEPAAPTVSTPTTAPVGEGVVKFDIKPSGRIDIDGITKGLSSAVKEVKLSAGTHTIEIFNGRAPPVKRTIEVKRDETITVSHTF